MTNFAMLGHKGVNSNDAHSANEGLIHENNTEDPPCKKQKSQQGQEPKWTIAIEPAALSPEYQHILTKYKDFIQHAKEEDPSLRNDPSTQEEMLQILKC